MKVGFSPKRKSLVKVFYIQNGIITGGFYEPVQFLLFRPVYTWGIGEAGGYRFNLCGFKYCLV